MKITRKQLRHIIKEEIERSLDEYGINTSIRKEHSEEIDGYKWEILSNPMVRYPWNQITTPEGEKWNRATVNKNVESNKALAQEAINSHKDDGNFPEKWKRQRR